MCKFAKKLLKILGVVLVLNIGLFCVFFFDLDGKLLFNVVEPFLKKHYDDMERRDTTLTTPYEIDNFCIVFSYSCAFILSFILSLESIMNKK